MGQARDKTSPREGPGAGIYPEEGTGGGDTRGSPSQLKPGSPLTLGRSGYEAEVAQSANPPAREAITFFLDVHKGKRIRQGSGLNPGLLASFKGCFAWARVGQEFQSARSHVRPAHVGKELLAVGPKWGAGLCQAWPSQWACMGSGHRRNCFPGNLQ